MRIACAATVSASGMHLPDQAVRQLPRSRRRFELLAPHQLDQQCSRRDERATALGDQLEHLSGSVSPPTARAICVVASSAATVLGELVVLALAGAR